MEDVSSTPSRTSTNRIMDHKENANKLKVKMGMQLTKIMLENCKVTDLNPKSANCGKSVPAFVHKRQRPSNAKGNSKLKMPYALLLSPPALNQLELQETKLEYLHPKHLPMLVPPDPWISPNSGGYLSLDTPLMRTKGKRVFCVCLRVYRDTVITLYRYTLNI